MAISSVGAGSGILTQDVLDQLRKADEAGKITPIDLKLANEKDKKDALEIIDANMTNLIDSINEIKSATLYNERSTEVTGSAVTATASDNSDIQDFTLEVISLATKQIEESAAFTDGEDSLVSGAAGQININIDGKDYKIDYTATTTLKELKNEINKVAGEKVDATLLNVSQDPTTHKWNTKLYISSANTGSNQDITITDVTGTIDSKITGMTNVQAGADAEFKFNNGASLFRSSNTVDDLITGVDIQLAEVGTSTVSISQNRENLMEKFDNFVKHFNSAISELNRMTKPSAESDERGIFSGESTIRGMKDRLTTMISSVGGSVGSLFDYGFDISKEGTISLDKDVLNKKIDENASNVKIFFSGGDFDNGDNTTTTVDGTFTELSNIVESYTKYNATLDQFKTTLTDGISQLNEQKTLAVERLDNKYETLKKQFIAYDIMISKINSASSMFVQIANAQTAAANG